jgi:hypothetical protein
MLIGGEERILRLVPHFGPNSRQPALRNISATFRTLIAGGKQGFSAPLTCTALVSHRSYITSYDEKECYRQTNYQNQSSAKDSDGPIGHL